MIRVTSYRGRSTDTHTQTQIYGDIRVRNRFRALDVPVPVALFFCELGCCIVLYLGQRHFWVTISISQRDPTFHRYIRSNTNRKQQHTSIETILFCLFTDQKTWPFFYHVTPKRDILKRAYLFFVLLVDDIGCISHEHILDPCTNLVSRKKYATTLSFKTRRKHKFLATFHGTAGVLLRFDRVIAAA